MQAERDANMQGQDTSPDRIMGRPGRRARGWFSFDLPVDPAHPMVLVATYNLDEWRIAKRAAVPGEPPSKAGQRPSLPSLFNCHGSGKGDTTVAGP
jgi:hypothetical protein